MLKLFLRRSSTKDQKPTVTKPAAAGELAQGELWLNNNHETPGLFARADDDSLIEFTPEKLFLQDGANAKPRTHLSKLRDVLHVKDLGCICDGIADDGATLNAAIYARYNGLGTSQSKEFVDIHASPGDVLKFATPVTVRQNRIRFIGNGAKIVCTGDYAFDFTQDSSANINEDGAIIDWKITGARKVAIHGIACAGTRIENNWLTGNGDGINMQAVAAVIRDNHIRENTGHGIVIQSAVVVGGARVEAQRCVLEQNRVYLNGGIGIYLKDGGGHYLGGNDLENNTTHELLIRCSFGNCVNGMYFEPKAGADAAIQIDNVIQDIPGRTADNNQIIGGFIGGGATYDINLAGGNSTFVSGVTLGSGKINIIATVASTFILPCNGAPAIVTNAGSRTLDMTASGKIKMYEGTANRVLIDATNPIGGVISASDDLLHLAGLRGISTTQIPSKNLYGFVDISGAATSANVTFSYPETDQAYGAFFGPWVLAGVPAAGWASVWMSARTNTGFTVNLGAAPGAGCTVRIHWMILR
jgi:parallel beta-helix repeat protein